MQIRQYNGRHKADFYIQCKGLHSGRPLKKPIPNCFSVLKSEPRDYELVYSIYISGKFKNFIGGTCIPYIRIDDVRKTISYFKDKLEKRNVEDFERIKKVDQQIEAMKKQLELLQEMKSALSIRSLKLR